MTIQVWPGSAIKLGATWDGKGVNFALFSENATWVELCLFNEAGQEMRIPLPEEYNFVWHGYIPDLEPGQEYGFRVHGPHAPKDGHRFNRHKLLIDPYAKALSGDVRHGDPLYGHDPEHPKADLSFSDTDSVDLMPKCVVVDETFDWEGDRLLRHPWEETIIYEVHVKGFTQQHPDIPSEQQGTYAGLAHPAAIKHLTDLGVTAVELLPVHHFHTYPGHLAEAGLRNYWGYDSLNFFAPYDGYSADRTPGGQVQEFKQMVKALHAAGIEVILDVVYNHTGEGSHLGPTLTLKGIDNATYYRLVEDDPRYYMDFTGCGNSLNVRHPQVLKLIMDSLRYWVLHMHVDGFRFDLASALARELFEVDSLAAFFDIIHQDPVLSTVKLIAEPWDLGDGGYQVGRFPLLWSEWNGKYRDTIRDFWRGEGATLAEFAYRFTGSSDLYAGNGRRPHASINFITAHDGFPLRDLVSYNEKHNEANHEGNRDGESHNSSWNCGAEGETDDPKILALRLQQQRNFLVTLMLSQGVPMMLGGDEIGRSQGGNNNCYCQDSPLSWFDWNLAQGNQDLLTFTQELISLRQQHPVFRRRHWFQGRAIHGSSVEDIGWFNPDGSDMDEDQWRDYSLNSIMIFLNGGQIPSRTKDGQPIQDDSFLLLFNDFYEPVEFEFPERLLPLCWQTIIDTTEPQFLIAGSCYDGDRPIEIKARSLQVLQCPQSLPSGLNQGDTQR